MIAAIAGDVATGRDEVLLYEGDFEGPVVRFATDMVSAELLSCGALLEAQEVAFNKI